MSNFTPAQQEAIHCLDKNMAVSAGAGAGKTKVLVQRYINILCKTSVLCDDILAITFTNKAATEMKQRIRSEVAQVLDVCNVEEKSRWQEIRYRLEFAPIGTIHSLCTRILRENPVEAGLDPNFVVYDEAQTQLLHQTVMQNVIIKAAKHDDQWLSELLEVYSRDQLTGMLFSIYEKLNRALANKNFLEQLSKPYLEAVNAGQYIMEQLISDCQELIRFSDVLNRKSPHYQAVMAVRDHWEVIQNALQEFVNNEQHQEILDQYLGKLQARSKDKHIVKSIRDNLLALKGLKNERMALALIPRLLEYFMVLDQEVKEYKAQRQIVTFNDLETKTLKLLENQHVCQSYCDRFRYVMVDEVQDISDVQRQIIYLLCGGHKHYLLQHKLFIVGDPKQSIYRFRGADVDIFSRVTKDIMNNGGKTVSLDINFRSTDKLLSALNEVFEPLMTTEYDKVRFNPLRAYRVAECERCVEFILLDKKEVGEGQGREQEALLMAQRIKQLVAQRTTSIDGRLLEFGDIAILFRSTSDIEVYESALQQEGIPYYVLGGRGFYQKQEIIDLLNLLRVVKNRYDELALAGVLRSPLFLLSDESLYWLKHYGGSLWNGLNQWEQIIEINSEQRSAMRKAKQLLDEMRTLRGYISVSELLVLGLNKTQYDTFLLTQFMGKQKFANVKKLIEIAKQHEQQQYCTINDFLTYVQKIMLVEIREGEAQIESETGNTVKLMTIHKSKGLEFPIVFLPDLHRQFPQTTDILLYDEELGLGVKIKDERGEWQKTVHYDQVAAREKLLSALELKRLLYVAMTRAKDYLILSGVGDKIGSQIYHENASWLDWFGHICNFNTISEIPDMLKVGDISIPVYKANHDVLHEKKINWYRQYCQSDRPIDSDTQEKVLQHTNIVREQKPDGLKVFSPTSLSKYNHCPRAFFYQYMFGLPLIEENGFCGSQKAPAAIVGIAVHKVCELYDKGKQLQEALCAAVNEIPKVWQDMVYQEMKPMLEVYFSSSFYQSVSCYQALTEQKIHFQIDHAENQAVNFQGIIDRIHFYEDGSLGIIDYKTDNVLPDLLDRKQGEYLWQMMLYKWGAEIVFKKPVRDITLYFLRAQMPLTMDIGDVNMEKEKRDILITCEYIMTHQQMTDYECKIDYCGFCSYNLFCEKDKKLSIKM